MELAHAVFLLLLRNRNDLGSSRRHLFFSFSSFYCKHKSSPMCAHAELGMSASSSPPPSAGAAVSCRVGCGCCRAGRGAACSRVCSSSISLPMTCRCTSGVGLTFLQGGYVCPQDLETPRLPMSRGPQSWRMRREASTVTETALCIPPGGLQNDLVVSVGQKLVEARGVCIAAWSSASLLCSFRPSAAATGCFWRLQKVWLLGFRVSDSGFPVPRLRCAPHQKGYTLSGPESGWAAARLTP